MSSPYINRFLQPDSVIPNLYNPQSLNRYSYVTNRPVNFNDPTGYRLDDGCEDYGCDFGTSSSTLSSSSYTPTPAGGNGQSDDEDPDDILGGNDSDCDTNNNNVADIPCPGLHTRDWNDISTRANGTDALCPLSASLVECYYAHASLDMGQSSVNIDSQAF